jgi:hypothetical protein
MALKGISEIKAGGGGFASKMNELLTISKTKNIGDKRKICQPTAK